MESGQTPAGSQVSRVPAQRTPPPQQADPAPATPPPAPARPGRLRLVLTVVGAATALLCLVGSAVAYVAYDNYTAPDRSAPDVVVDNYLRAYLVDRNDVRTGLYVCSEGSQDLGAVEALRADLLERGERFQTPLIVKWGSLDVHEDGDSAEVRVTLTITAVVQGQTQRGVQDWRFVTRLQDDWRVCGARRLA